MNNGIKSLSRRLMLVSKERERKIAEAENGEECEILKTSNRSSVWLGFFTPLDLIQRLLSSLATAAGTP